MAQGRFNFNSRGFSLIEVVIAMGLLMVVSLGVAQLFAASTRVNLKARGQTSTTALAEQKLEQIRSLTWGFDDQGLGLPVSDVTTNLAVYPPAKNGSGLNPSPGTALQQNTSGCVDYLDGNGNWVGTGSTPPSTTVYIRRWSIQPLPTNPNNTLVIQVLVTTRENDELRAGGATSRIRLPGDALLTSVKTRKSS